MYLGKSSDIFFPLTFHLLLRDTDLCIYTLNRNISKCKSNPCSLVLLLYTHQLATSSLSMALECRRCLFVCFLLITFTAKTVEGCLYMRV